MRFRKLRIAWSVGCVLAGVLLIVLWVRSYLWKDFAVNGGVLQIYLESCNGKFGFIISPQPPDLVGSGWGFHSRLRDEDPWAPLAQYDSVVAFTYDARPNDLTVTAPFWFPILVIFFLAAAPWIRWRFRLRTLLIATTLVAVVLGLVVWGASS